MKLGVRIIDRDNGHGFFPISSFYSCDGTVYRHAGLVNTSDLATSSSCQKIVSVHCHIRRAISRWNLGMPSWTQKMRQGALKEVRLAL